ncbi:GldG family protein [bacterium]|nr:GldG family protein [bacterium]
MKKVSIFSALFGLLFAAYALIEYSILNVWENHDTILAVASLILLGMYLILDFKTVKQNIFHRSAKLNLKTLVGTFLVFFILAGINFIASRKSFRFDASSGKIYTLSYQSIEILKNLDKEVLILAFFKPEQSDDTREILEVYKSYTKKLSFKIIDPDKNHSLSSRYGIEKYGTIVFECGELKDFTQNVSEQTITNGILNVTRKVKKGIYFTEGHQETDIYSEEKTGYSQIGTKLYLQSYEPKKIIPAQTAELPQDLSVLVVANPKNDFLDAEIDFLEKYLVAKGSICVLLEPGTQLPKLFNFLAKWGIFVRDDIIVDVSPANQTYGGDPTLPLVTDYASHPITKNFGKTLTVYPMARSLDTLKTEKYLLRTILASTSANSWGETTLTNGKVSFEQGIDVQGPLGVAVISELVVNPDEKSGKIAAFGDSEFIDNFYFDKTGNSDFFLNTVSWLASDDDLISIRPNKTNETKLEMTQGETVVNFMMTIFILPGLFLFLGIFVYLKRKE